MLRTSDTRSVIFNCDFKQTPMINKIKTPLIVLIVSATLYMLPSGQIIEVFFPCGGTPLNSGNCYFIAEILIRNISAGIFIMSMITIGAKIFRAKKSQHQTTRNISKD